MRAHSDLCSEVLPSVAIGYLVTCQTLWFHLLNVGTWPPVRPWPSVRFCGSTFYLQDAGTWLLLFAAFGVMEDLPEVEPQHLASGQVTIFQCWVPGPMLETVVPSVGGYMAMWFHLSLAGR